MNSLINLMVILIFCGSLSINAMLSNMAKFVPKFSTFMGGIVTGKISRKSFSNQETGEKTYTEVFQLPKPEGYVKICEVLRGYDEVMEPARQKPFSLTLLRHNQNCVEITAVLNKEMIKVKDESEREYGWLYALLGYVWTPWGHDAVIANEDKTFLNAEKDGIFRGDNRLSLAITRPALEYAIKIPHDADVEVECEGNINYIRNGSTFMHIKAEGVLHQGGDPKQNNYWRGFAEREMNHWNYHWGTNEIGPRTTVKTRGTVTIIYQ